MSRKKIFRIFLTLTSIFFDKKIFDPQYTAAQFYALSTYTGNHFKTRDESTNLRCSKIWKIFNLLNCLFWYFLHNVQHANSLCVVFLLSKYGLCPLYYVLKIVQVLSDAILSFPGFKREEFQLTFDCYIFDKYFLA